MRLHRVALVVAALSSLLACTLLLGVQDLSDVEAGVDAASDAPVSVCVTEETGIMDVTLVTNGAFDAGTSVCGADWTPLQNTPSITMAPGYDGGRACMICGLGISQVVSVTYPAGTTFTGSAWLSAGDAGAGGAELYVTFQDCAGHPLNPGLIAAHALGGWFQVSNVVTTDAEVSEMRVMVDCTKQTQDSGCGCFLVDDVTVIATHP
jgi:hypothetical protein